MSLKTGIERLALYNQWMNTQLYTAVESLSTEQLNEDKSAYFGSVMGTLNHIMVGDIFWFKRFSTHSDSAQALQYFSLLPTPSSLKHILHTHFKDLYDQRKAMDQIIVDFTKTLKDTDLDEPLIYKNTQGNIFRKNYGTLILNIFNHQTHHRGQVTTLLNQFGIDVGVTDFLACIPDE